MAKKKDAQMDLLSADSAVPSRTARSSKANAQSMALRQRDISVSEFFSRNRHLLGFDNPRRSLLTGIKEAVDNSLDACEEAGILPDIEVQLTQVADDRYIMRVCDNGPGIVKSQIPNIFGKLLYGSKFHRLRMSRGQQGIGISAASMYGQLTTGKATRVISRTGARRSANCYEMQIDTARNKPQIVREEQCEWHQQQGTQVEIEMEARYQRGRQSVDDYLRQTALANPHLQLLYTTPDGRETLYERSSEEMPQEAQEIKPHPHGIELGILMKMLQGTLHRTLQGFLTQEFSRVSVRVAKDICTRADLKPNGRPKSIAREESDRLFKAINATKLMRPPTDCIVPIGEELLTASLKANVRAGFYASTTRPPAVYRGNPFQIEVAVAYGGDINPEGSVQVMRFANRVPLLYQPSACAITRSLIDTDWRNYRISQSNNALPTGPLVVMVHVASVWVPFTSESKDAVAHYDEIIKEIRLGVQECGRKVGEHIGKIRREAEAVRKKDYIAQYIGHIATALQEIIGDGDKKTQKVEKNLQGLLERSRS
ncbi:MAG: DNA topoisomerase VI subunit B [Gemmatimonadetes bacterium]|nr:DNA topoisomerase VI subunit B [Gemmatimonadota bacterium]